MYLKFTYFSNSRKGEWGMKLRASLLAALVANGGIEGARTDCPVDNLSEPVSYTLVHFNTLSPLFLRVLKS